MIELQDTPKTMTDIPFPPLLDRLTAITHSKRYAEQLHLVEDLVNFGSSLMPRLIPGESKNPTDAILVFHLVREVIVQIDALQVLMANGCLPGSASVCRSLVEKQHLCLWALSNDMEQKMQHLFVGGLRSSRARSKAALTGHKENDALGNLRSDLAKTDLPKLAAQEVQKLDLRLKASDVAGIDAAFERLLRQNKYEPPWTMVYCLGRSQNAHKGSARKIAEEIGKLAEYQVYYTDYSSGTHGQDILSSFAIRDGHIDVSNIRDGSDFVTALHLAINSAVELYKALLEHYLPSEVTAFCNKYITDWMPRLPR